MIKKQREKIARKVLRLVERGVIRKQAIMQVGNEAGICRATIYNWLGEFKISLE